MSVGREETSGDNSMEETTRTKWNQRSTSRADNFLILYKES